MRRRPIRVAVIDSGVHASHPHIARVEGGFPELDFVDRLGHGTAVMAAIQQHAPSAEYFALRVFDRELKTSIARIVEALAWAVEREMDVINLSLGTANAAHAEKFQPFVQRALIVSAAGMLPGDLEGVIRVAPDPELARDQYRCDGPTYYASPYPRPIEGVPVERNLSGSSFAVANMTGFVVRACEDLPAVTYQAVCSKLKR